MKHPIRRLCAVLCAAVLLTSSASALSVKDARALLEEYYIDPLPESAYRAGTLKDLFSALGDPYSYYMSAEDYQDFNSTLENDRSVVGIGVSVLFVQDGLLISSVLPGGSAIEAGLKKGDLIIAVDGKSCAPGSENNGVAGEEGTFVTITVRHANGSEEDYRLQRRYIEIRNTVVTVSNGVGLIECTSFGSQTGTYFTDGITQYDDGTHLWVVDLRGNSGGLSTAAVTAAGAFTGSAPLLYFRDKAGNYSYNACHEDYLTENPVIVLTDGSSASACEVFAAAIRDMSAGITVGERTFGKGTAQELLDKESHSEYFDGDALKVTIYRFYSTNGNTTDRIGVIPTLLLSDDYTDAAAELLGSKEPIHTSGYLRLTLGGWHFYVNLNKAAQDEYSPAFHELLAALPPDAAAALGNGSGWTDLTAAEVVTRYGDAARSRFFTDLTESDYADEINTLAAYGILKGTGDGQFRPEDTLTRAQLCALLAQALNLTTSTENHFTDVPSTRWFADAVNAMAELGIVEGRSSGRFDPNGLVTEQEFITILGRLAAFLNFYGYEYTNDLLEGSLAISNDLQHLAPWARRSAAVLTGMMLTADNEPLSLLHRPLDEIDPTAPILREDAAASLHRLLTQLKIIFY